MSGITVRRKAKTKSIAEKYLFDAEWYKAQLGNNIPDDENLYCHYLSHGVVENLSPHPLFDIDYYRISLGGAEIDGNPIDHFLDFGWRSGASCTKYFNVGFYLDSYPDVADGDINPLLHYLLHGADEGRRPNAAFDTAWYLLQNGFLAEAGMNPLVHWVTIGQAEGRSQNAQEELALRQRKSIVDFDRRVPSAQFSERAVRQVEPSSDAFIAMPEARLEQALDGLKDVKASALSFDVWDTLLRRRCHPDEIKLQTCRYILIKYYWKLKPIYRSCASLYAARKNAEALAAPFGDWEFRLKDAALYFINEVVEPATTHPVRVAIAEECVEQELASELHATVPDETAKEFVNGQNGMPVVVVSDFYMSSDMIGRLLEKNGYWRHRILKIFSSSDLMANKRSGTIFPIVANELSSAPSDIVHVGDSATADVETARKMGFRALHYLNPDIERYKRWLQVAMDARLDGNSTVHAERVKDLLAQYISSVPEDRFASKQERGLFESGVSFAPVALGFILHVIEQAHRSNVSLVHFFTREGIFIRRVYDAVVDCDPYGTNYPASNLLEVSRLATFGPSLAAVDVPNLMRLWNLYSTQSPRAFCKSLNLDLVAAAKFFVGKKLPFDEPIEYPWENERFLKVIESDAFQTFVGEQINEQKSLLIRYLESKGLDSKEPSAMVVDLGWRGTIQDNIARISDLHLHGCYLALFKLFNEQPANTSKTAWLFDLNSNPNRPEPQEIGPLEMLFNGPGGSVTGYRETPIGEVEAVTKVIPNEEKVILDGVGFFQEGILEAMPALVEYVRLHALTSEDFVALGNELVGDLLEHPATEIADLFTGLHHNETFGTGVTKNMRAQALGGSKSLKGLHGASFHDAIESVYKKSRWKSGLLRSSTFSNRLSRLTEAQYRTLPAAVFDEYRGGSLRDKSVALYVPAPIAGSGGHRTIFNVGRKLAKRGCNVTAFLERHGEGVDVARAYAADVPMDIEVGWQAHAQSDMAIATIAHSAPFVRSLKHAQNKGYLIQDLEALFNPVGDTYADAEHSYTCVENNFTIGNWLGHFLSSQYGQRSVGSGLGIDTEIYRELETVERENAICLLFQPEKPRRSPRMAMDALRIVKAVLPKTKIYVYGSNAPLSADFEIENLGLVHDLRMLNELYNRCKVGLCISMSNPSRIPFEMMAAGTVPVDVFRYNNLFDYAPGTVSLAYQSSFSLARAMVELLEDEQAWQDRSTRCAAFSKVRSLEWETDVITNNISAILGGEGLLASRPELTYTDEPVIAANDLRPETMAFCDWQVRLAQM